MSLLNVTFKLIFTNAFARPTHSFPNITMLGRAASSFANNHHNNVQQPLSMNGKLSNIQKQPMTVNNSKRKFERSSSNLAALHQQQEFDENLFDFGDDDDIRAEVYSSSEIKYPSLPPVPSQPKPSQKHPVSSATVPWSSSPQSHLQKPALPKIEPKPIEREDQAGPAKKRRKLPWAAEQDAELQASTHLVRPNSDFTPLPKDKDSGQKYPWNKTASAVKEEQKEMRKKFGTKQTAIKLTGIAGTTVQKTTPSTHLSEEQRAVARAVVDGGKSVFFTGSAGTGKSVLMKAIIAQLRMKYRRDADRLAITASTGLAACVIEGSTIHSWAGIGLGKEPAQELAKKIRRNAKTKSKWMRTKVLIIDEISMVDGELFDKLENIARIIRGNGRPFGGIQLVVTGDFFQLPPVPERNQVAKFAFDATTWKTCIELTILLTHVFRQKDPTFANMLNEMRLGKLSTSTIAEFRKLSRPLDFKDDVEATELFPTRNEVDSANNGRMTRLDGQLMTYMATDGGVADLAVRNRVLANFMAPEKLTLKKGAQVMLIKNIDTQLVNGTLGKVLCFMDEATWITYKGDEDSYRAAYREGMSDDEDTKVAREKFNAARFKNQDPGSTPTYWPMVRFPLADGTVRDILCPPEEWKTESAQNEVVATRKQVPLILAWALSIHKAQGQTLNRVKVDLGKVFERGQAYVALSRATSQAGLQVLRFDAKKVMVHPKVTTFYQELTSIHDHAAKTKKQTLLTQDGKEIIDLDDEERVHAQAY